MALLDIAALRTAVASPTQALQFIKNHTMIPTRWSSTWARTGLPSAGATPGAAAICDRATLGGIGQVNKSAGEQRAWLRNFGTAHISAGSSQIAIMLVDRLAHMGGLNGTLTTAQAVGTPTLTRSTSGVGVVAATEIYTAVGATPANATLVYDSDSGTGHTSPATAFVDAGTNSNAASAMTVCSLASGDKGVKAVTSVQLSANTGTAGSFGISLYKPLWCWPSRGGVGYPMTGDPLHGGSMPVIDDDACLMFLVQSGAGQAGVTVLAELGFLED